jgi:hypothetical protein
VGVALHRTLAEGAGADGGRQCCAAHGGNATGRGGLPFFDEHDVKLLRVLTDRGSEFCGNPERHEYELYLAVEDIDHSRTKTKSPQTNGICERFHKTVLNEFYRVAFRKKVYHSLDELQVDLDCWMKEYNEARPHQGRWCFGKTPMQTFPRPAGVVDTGKVGICHHKNAEFTECYWHGWRGCLGN